jgi:hypothetical protein
MEYGYVRRRSLSYGESDVVEMYCAGFLFLKLTVGPMLILVVTMNFDPWLGIQDGLMP